MARQKYPSDEIDKTMVRFPPGLMDRVKEAAARNGRSMNAEIITTLEKEYPPKSIDVNLLSEFLTSVIGVSAPDGDTEYLNRLNNALAKAGQPWTVRSGWDGEVTFYPYATDEKDIDSSEK